MKTKTKIFLDGIYRYLLISTVLAWQLSVADSTVLVDRIVAVVENGAVMQSEFDNRVYQIQMQLMNNPNVQMPPKEDVERQVLERLVVETIQLQRAERLGIRIDDLTLNEAMQRLAAQNNMDLETFRDTITADGVDYGKFREELRKSLTRNRLRQRDVDRKIQVTEEEIDDLIASEREALNREVEYHLAHILITVPEAASPEILQEAQKQTEQIRTRVLNGEDFSELAIAESDGQLALEAGDLGWRDFSSLPSLFTKQVSTMKIGDISEVIRSPSGFHLVKLIDRRGGQELIITETRARHILIKSNGESGDSEAWERLKSLKVRIENGADFGELAKANSEDTASAINGGELPWSKPGDMVPEFEKVMNSLEMNQISNPFRSPYGWHIVQVQERRQLDNTQDLMREQARKFLFQRKVEEETELWVRRLRDEAYVDFRIKIGARTGG